MPSPRTTAAKSTPVTTQVFPDTPLGHAVSAPFGHPAASLPGLHAYSVPAPALAPPTPSPSEIPFVHSQTLRRTSLTPFISEQSEPPSQHHHRPSWSQDRRAAVSACSSFGAGRGNPSPYSLKGFPSSACTHTPGQAKDRFKQATLTGTPSSRPAVRLGARALVTRVNTISISA